VSRFVGEAYEFVFNARAIPRADALDLSAVHGRLVQIVADDLRRFRSRVGHPTRDLFTTGHPAQATLASVFHVEQTFAIARIVKGKKRRLLVASLLLHSTKIQAAPEEAGRGSGLEPAQLDACLQKTS
jgi:hypothetical protein